ncbi:MAG TPA: tetratricopeptide repeat protein, partial [bacterium]|nr:tetratricopeptide repeat protein [bacterium]
INNLFLKKYFDINGIGLVIKKMDEFPLLSEKLFFITLAECEKGKINFCYFTGRYFDELKDYGKATDLYKKACDGENMLGCAGLGLMYYEGSGVSQDKKKAVELLRKACAGGNMLGCVRLGWMYAIGSGVVQDTKKAVTFFTKACDGENMDGCSNLGAMYINGSGVPYDKKKAAELFKKACDGGVDAACEAFKLLSE